MSRALCFELLVRKRRADGAFLAWQTRSGHHLQEVLSSRILAHRYTITSALQNRLSSESSACCAF